jgi:hypothetical protein
MGVIQGLRRVVVTWFRSQSAYDSQYRPLPRLLTGLLDEIQRVFDDADTPVALYIRIIEDMVDHFLKGTTMRCDEQVLTKLENIAIQLERLYSTTENQARREIIQKIPAIIKKILIASSLSNTILERWSYQHDSDLRRVRDLPDYKNSFEEVVPVSPANGPLMNKQLLALKIALNGFFPEPSLARALLTSDNPNEKRRILAIGSDIFTWCIEVAQAFPDAKVTGIDHSSANLPTWGPSNCEFRKDGVDPAPQFDIVYARFMRSGIRNCPAVDEVEQYLKPGGMIIWMARDPKLYQGWSYKPFPQEQTPPLQTLVTHLSELTHCEFDETLTTIPERNAYKPLVTDALKEINKGLWSRTNLDPSTCKAASLYLPIGDWMEYPKDEAGESNAMAASMRLKSVGALTRQHFEDIMKKYGNKLTEDLKNNMRARITEECIEYEPSIRVALAWGLTKRPSPPVASPSDSTMALSTSILPPSTESNMRESRLKLIDIFSISTPYVGYKELDPPERSLHAASYFRPPDRESTTALEAHMPDPLDIGRVTASLDPAVMPANPA